MELSKPAERPMEDFCAKGDASSVLLLFSFGPAIEDILVADGVENDSIEDCLVLEDVDELSMLLRVLLKSLEYVLEVAEGVRVNGWSLG